MNMDTFKSHLCNQLIPFWNKMVDAENGGFYGYADDKGLANKAGEKGCILNSRILWFYSASYNLLKDANLLDKATHAYDYMKKCFCDPEFKGVYWSVSAEGVPLDTTKHTYNHSFAIYALSEYYKASKDQAALDLANELYDIIEEKCRDDEGYFEAYDREFKPVSNEKLSENGVEATRTMNTLLHLLEAYTELYRISKREKVEASIREILTLFKEKVYNEEIKRCEVFFDKEYNSLISLESYGHDIEASWLLERGCDVLGDKEVYADMLPVINGLALGACEHGMDPKYQAMNNECEEGRVDGKKVWWVQAEAVTGFYNAYKLNPEMDQYKTLSEQVWDYIQEYVVDKNTGEWVENITAENVIEPGQDLVHPWKCPYHNGRMCIEMINRLS